MKSIIAVALAGFVASVSAQGLSDIPTCALPCLLNGLAATNCDATDFKCACSTPAYISTSKTCIDAVCSVADQQKALGVSGALCSAAGVPITVPSGTSAASSAAVSSPAVSSPAVSSAPAATTAAPSGTHAGNATISHPGNVTATTTSPPQQSSNAASRLGAMGGVVALGLGLAAALGI